jgi:glycosyltransferase involved in cell wall biosynthesis
MKILLISYYFPPYNTIGAIRSGKMAKYLTKLGHDVKVISANNQPLQSTLPLEIDSENLFSTKWLNVNKLPELAMGGRENVINKGFAVKNDSLKKKLGLFYKTITNFPDGQIGWYPFAKKQADELLSYWIPDIIYASASPYTSLLIANYISKRYSIPWVAELRDLWVDNHYFNYPRYRAVLEKKLEKKILSKAAMMVTVSEPLADKLQKKYTNSVITILNGFDHEDYEDIYRVPDKGEKLKIIYTGTIYSGYQDPTPLFKALTMLEPRYLSNIEVNFYGKYLEEVTSKAEEYNLTDIVKVQKLVPYEESLSLQQNADLLLLLLWNDDREKGVYTGKLFEYIGAKRPILAIGKEDGVVSDLLKSRNLGIICNDSSELCEYLETVINEKIEKGYIQNFSNVSNDDFSRLELTKVLEKYLFQIIKK